jgi:Ca2+-binding EF-hand superfamily protein
MNVLVFRTALLIAGFVFADLCVAQILPATASDRFEQLDRNSDGAVSKDEYDSDLVFDALDADNNERVTATELQDQLGPQRDGELSAADRIRTADLNTDGELTAEELGKSVQNRFAALDANQDGSLDLGELTSGFGRP